jgi:hypothetical protein
VGDLLGRFPGAWITPDFPIRADVGNVSERQRRFRDIIAGATERRMYDNAFADTDELAAFLANLGLTAEVRMQADLAPDLVSPNALGLSDSLVDRLKSRLRLWIAEPS